MAFLAGIEPEIGGFEAVAASSESLVRDPLRGRCKFSFLTTPDLGKERVAIS